MPLFDKEGANPEVGKEKTIKNRRGIFQLKVHRLSPYQNPL